MGSIKRFVKKVARRTRENQDGSATPNHVGAPRTVSVPSSHRIQSHARVHPVTAAISHQVSSPHPTPLLLPTLDPIQPVSPIRIPTAIRSTSPAPTPKFFVADQNESDDDDSYPVEESLEGESFQCRDTSSPLPREDTTATVFHPPTPTPARKMTSASFNRLPEYIGSSDSSVGVESPRTRNGSPDSLEDFEVPRTGTGSLYPDIEDSDISGMLRPLEFPAEQEDVFSSSSSPDQHDRRNSFSLPGPPSYHGPTFSDGATPSRLSQRPSSIRMLDGPTPQRIMHRGSNWRGRDGSPTHRRTLTPYPMSVPQQESSPLPAVRGSEEAPRTPPRMVYLPPRSPSSPLVEENSFFTRMEALPSSTPVLPRSDDLNVNLQEVLLNHSFFPDAQGHLSVED
ncbi:hypothetical protein PMIN06_009071 [Paraphaeosphaeria minitans]